MFSNQIAAAAAAVPLLITGQPVVEFAQNAGPYANWVFLYEDSFEDRSGREITQAWWLSPDTTHESNVVNFRLLARRSPISDNGTAAAVFDYVADCETKAYTIERTEFLDVNDQTLDVQMIQRVMEPSDPESPFHDVLEDLCGGIR
ncbi:MAG: hypothetical protein ACFBSG_15485 [Leptolyngbyaceae cyanobacterium]